MEESFPTLYWETQREGLVGAGCSHSKCSSTQGVCGALSYWFAQGAQFLLAQNLLPVGIPGPLYSWLSLFWSGIASLHVLGV